MARTTDHEDFTPARTPEVAMTHGPGPTVRRRQLGKELRRLRENAGKTIAEAADWVGIKPPTISKIENDRQAIRPTNVRLLL
jgi:hypothetical protein